MADPYYAKQTSPLNPLTPSWSPFDQFEPLGAGAIRSTLERLSAAGLANPNSQLNRDITQMPAYGAPTAQPQPQAASDPRRFFRLGPYFQPSVSF